MTVTQLNRLHSSSLLPVSTPPPPHRSVSDFPSFPHHLAFRKSAGCCPRPLYMLIIPPKCPSCT